MADNVTEEMFNEEFAAFWEAGGQRKYTVEEMDLKFQYLFRTYFRVCQNKLILQHRKMAMENAMMATFEDHTRRQAYRMMLTNPESPDA